MTREDEVRRVLGELGKLGVDIGDVGVDADLYQLGLSSHASVNVMLGLEDAFDIEFPDRLLRKSTFATIGTICSAIAEVMGETAATA